MDQTKLIGEITNDAPRDNEIRVLDDLELAVTAGGDGIVIWTPPTP